MTPDRQLVAFAGKPDGSVELVDRRVTPELHVFLRDAGDFTPISHSIGDIDADPALWEDALKVSGCVNLTVYAGTVKGGNEDVVDVMRSKHCAVLIQDAHPRGNFVATIKGQSEYISLGVGTQHGHGKEVDYDYGNNAPSHNGYTRNCALTVESVQGSALVRLLRSGPVETNGGPFSYAFPPLKPTWFHSIIIWILNRIQ